MRVANHRDLEVFAASGRRMAAVKAEILRQGAPFAHADDLAQDAFLAVYKKLLHGDVIEDALAYTTQSVRFMIWRRFRAKSRFQPDYGDLADTSRAPLDTITVAEDVQRLHVAIDTLPPNIRFAIRDDLCGHPLARTAAQLDVSVSTACRLRQQARERLAITCGARLAQ